MRLDLGVDPFPDLSAERGMCFVEVGREVLRGATQVSI
jgi:hypothetical protein